MQDTRWTGQSEVGRGEAQDQCENKLYLWLTHKTKFSKSSGSDTETDTEYIKYAYIKSLENTFLCKLLFVHIKRLIIDKYYHHHHHHHIVLVARISLTLSRHSSLSFIALGRSSGQHPVSSHSCWMYVWAGRPAFAWPCVGIHKSTSLMSSSLLLQQCPACLVRLTWIVFVIGGRWPYSWCLVGCCCQDLFRIARSILV